MSDPIPVRIRRLPHGEGLPLPAYATAGAAGMDVHAAEEACILPGETVTVRTGLQVALPKGWEFQFRSRSGMAARRGLSVLNSPGTIDEDFRGELVAILHNHGREAQRIERGDRVGQLVLAPVHRARWEEVEELPESERGTSGLGSTGR